jgi:hypothetical protein
VGKESPQEEEKMTIDSHERSHNRRKKDAKADGRLKISQEDFDREMVELKEKLSMIENLLDECEKDQWYGWTMKKKKVKWKLLQTRLRQSMYAKRELRVAEYGMQVIYCEPEKGDILGEGYEENERLAGSLMNSLQSSYQHDDVLIEELDEATRPHSFYSDTLCVIAGNEKEETGLLVETVIKDEEGGNMIFKRITVAQNLNLLMRWRKMKKFTGVNQCKS